MLERKSMSRQKRLSNTNKAYLIGNNVSACLFLMCQRLELEMKEYYAEQSEPFIDFILNEIYKTLKSHQGAIEN